MGLFILTGSQQFGLLSGISQSLAGRMAFVELLPLSFGELKAAGLLSQHLNEMLLKGGYPIVTATGDTSAAGCLVRNLGDGGTDEVAPECG